MEKNLDRWSRGDLYRWTRGRRSRERFSSRAERVLPRGGEGAGQRVDGIDRFKERRKGRKMERVAVVALGDRKCVKLQRSVILMTPNDMPPFCPWAPSPT